MDKRTNNDLQNITHKTKDRLTRTQLKSGCERKNELTPLGFHFSAKRKWPLIY
jgi:hypothetical protein